VDVDAELSKLRTWDAFVLAAVLTEPDDPRHIGGPLRHALLLRLVGARRSLKRLEHLGYLEPGWSLSRKGAHYDVTELGRRVGTAAAAVIAANNESEALPIALVRIRFGRRFVRSAERDTA
jgi:hypothetical protein